VPVGDQRVKYGWHPTLGAYVAYQVALRLPRQGEHAPRAIVVAASNAPGTRKPAAGISELPDEAFIDHIHNKHGGIPAVVRHDPSWRTAVIPALRADLRMLETYPFERAEPLVCPLLALGGTDDAQVPRDNLDAWAAITRGKATTRQFAGGHFFLYPDFNASVSAGGAVTAAQATAPLAAVFHFIQHGTDS
jgi:surfactin synthase thioesterase subunit